MADDLAEDWWVEENDNSEEGSQETENLKEKENDSDGSKKKSLKRPLKDDQEQDGNKNRKKRKSSSAKKKNKKESTVELKRKRITDVPEDELSKPGTVEDVHVAMTKALKQRLGEEALKDLLPDSATDFYANNVQSLEPSAYLKSTLQPVWRSALKKSLFLKKTGSPFLLIVTSSAIRAVDLNRKIKDFLDGKCKVAKLFAKHMKVEEQKKFLNKTNCQVGIGTPGRISLLIKQGALKTEDLVAVVLDWNWRDQKLKRLADGPETRNDLVSLLREHLLEAVRGSSCKFALM